VCEREKEKRGGGEREREGRGGREREREREKERARARERQLVVPEQWVMGGSMVASMVEGVAQAGLPAGGPQVVPTEHGELAIMPVKEKGTGPDKDSPPQSEDSFSAEGSLQETWSAPFPLHPSPSPTLLPALEVP
jgi:hypothetical protein